MYFLAPIILSGLFLVLVLFSSCIFKLGFKIQNFFGFCYGVCCFALSILAGMIYFGVLVFLVLNNLKDKNAPSFLELSLENLGKYSKGILIVFWLVIAGLYAILFVFIFLFTKKVSEPKHDYNTIFMFVSGYITFPFTFAYSIWIFTLIGINAVINDSIKKGISEIEALNQRVKDKGNFYFISMAFVYFLEALLFAGTIIMCMLHHRKVNSFIIWINVACFFFPSIAYSLFVFTLKSFFIEYPAILPSLVSISFALYFYFRNETESSPGEIFDSQEPYALSN